MTEHLREQWKWSEWGDQAPRLRNARARELRKRGYKVKCSTWDFSDLAVAGRKKMAEIFGGSKQG